MCLNMQNAEFQAGSTASPKCERPASASDLMTKAGRVTRALIAPAASIAKTALCSLMSASIDIGDTC